MENRKELGFQAPISGVVAQVITSRYRLRQKLDVKYHYFASISVKYSSERKTTLVGSGPISPSNGKKVILNIRRLTQKSMCTRTTKFQIISDIINYYGKQKVNLLIKEMQLEYEKKKKQSLKVDAEKR